MPIKTNVILRRADREDLDILVEWMEAPDFQRFLYGDPLRSPRQIREQIVGMLGRGGNNALPTGIYLMLDAGEDGPLGLISLQSISWRNRTCNLDVYLGKKEIRSTMVIALGFYRAMEYAFYELNLHRVSAFIYAFNTPSWRIMEMSGAVREVTLKDHVARDGKLHDMYGYGFLRGEFEALRERYAQRFPDASLSVMRAKLAEQAAAGT